MYTEWTMKLKGDFRVKKLVSLLLAVLLLFSLAALPVQAGVYEVSTTLPVINIRGNAQTIYDEDGVAVYDFDPDPEQIKACAKRVLPLLLKGFVTNNFDEYYRAFGEEMAKIYYHCQLDCNGDPQWGTGISAEEKASLAQRMQENPADDNGRYAIQGVTFPFDWRLDPLENAKKLNELVDALIANTGKDKVNLYCNCLGGEMLLAYIAEYGTEKINALAFTETVAFGSELVDETFSGRIDFDPDAIVRFTSDDFLADEMKDQSTLRIFLNETMILANETGALDRFTKAFKRVLYDRLYEGLAPELCLASFGTWPGYWGMVTKEHYAETKAFIFGKPGSERYEQYAGLIKKLDNWDKKVRQQIPVLLQNALDNGVKFGISVRYGHQFPPVLESNNVNGDVWVSAKNASLGATVADIGTTLPKNYLARREKEGYGKYLSPDGMIDASTCAFPDQTWFIKGAVHNNHTLDTDRLWMQLFDFDGIPTVEDIQGYSRFMVFRPETNVVPMTKENMNTETYEVNAKEKTFFEKVKYFFEHVLLWYKALFALLKN